jgi:serine acetyltransferase
MIPTHRHPRQTSGRVRQGLRADNPGNVVAAVADVKADSEVVAHKNLGEKGEKAKRRKGKIKNQIFIGPIPSMI